jgi:hypothetical protein
MGDYTKSGAKIGSCGEAYYATKQMLEAVNDNDSVVAAYLDPKNKCAFAFPFPEYDGMQIGQMSNFHEGERVELTFFFPANIESHHTQVLYQLSPKGAPMKNLYCQCPQKYKEGASEHDHIYFRLYGQIWHEGSLKITAECPYCKCSNIFDKEEAELICTTFFDKFSDNKDTQAYYSEIAKRIRATYE